VIQLKEILCPTDFSDLSLKPLCFAGELASTFHAELYLLHVFEGYDSIVLNPELAMTRKRCRKRDPQGALPRLDNSRHEA